ncbi:MAG: Fe-S cluster assembly protein SufB [Candidatus Marinimicrobia bacterium]|nr:Fe-S cluster assembly protein SufB [Candidatus Neomarinimicrobiota bacterium]MCF7828035.1 Fe-S cluster assembly protein SufB [Candidatus Neomarinimicrobiota bacterium]MCF7879210.1 Fe-S cluster assembly protein SufB [Candidatus Neomarinimicrobiota bacterium]
MSDTALQTANRDYEYGWHSEHKYKFKAPPGLTEDLIKDISKRKEEPEWMLEKRLEGFREFMKKPMPTWGGDLSDIDFNEIIYYLQPDYQKNKNQSWDDVPDDLKETFERIGIPEAERKFLAGVSNQFDSESVYSKLKGAWEEKGVLFFDMDAGLKEHPEIVKEYFGTLIPASDNKFAALNTAVWSGGSFIYVPEGVKVGLPLQAYFRINAENAGQFERTLIIVDKDAEVHYIEGCTSPSYSTNALHSAVVELIAHEGATLRYTTLQNWYSSVYNLVTKRSKAEKNARVEWIDYNGGSKVTMKYPSVYLVGEGAHAEIVSIATAKENQHQDTGGKAIHAAPNTTSKVTSKSISFDGGRTSYRGLIKVHPGMENCKSDIECDALMMGSNAESDTYPYMEIEDDTAQIEHEATVSKIGEEQLFYLMSRGLTEDQAKSTIVHGFLDEFERTLPMEYAVEFNRLVDLQMEGSVG